MFLGVVSALFGIIYLFVYGMYVLAKFVERSGVKIEPSAGQHRGQ